MPLWAVILMGLPLPLLSEALSVGGKSLAEYLYLFLLGYFVFADDRVIAKAEKHSPWLAGVGLAASVLNVYLFIWSGREYPILNTATKFITEWVMIIALIGLAKRYLSFSGRISGYMSRRSMLYYFWHFIWVVLFQYILHGMVGNHTLVLFAGTVVLSCIMTIVCCEICVRIPFLSFLTGTKYSPEKQG